MTLTEFATYIGISGGVLAVATAILKGLQLMFGLANTVATIKTNDLKHIDEKLDRIAEGVEAVHTKLDGHIQYHLEHKL